MAKLAFGLNQSLDGHVDHQKSRTPLPALFRHGIEHVRDLSGMVWISWTVIGAALTVTLSPIAVPSAMPDGLLMNGALLCLTARLALRSGGRSCAR